MKIYNYNGWNIFHCIDFSCLNNMRNKLTVIKRRAAVLNQINNLTNKCGKNHYKESFNYLINVVDVV